MNKNKKIINTYDEFEIDDEFIEGYKEFLQELEIFQKLEKMEKEYKSYERDKWKINWYKRKK